MSDRKLMQQALVALVAGGLSAHATKKAREAAITALRERLAQPVQEPVAWRELCRRLYVELFHCDQQMMSTLDVDAEPMWTQGKTVRDVLADAKAALEKLDTRPQAREPLTDEQIDPKTRTKGGLRYSPNYAAGYAEGQKDEREACWEACDRLTMYGPVSEAQTRYNQAYGHCKDAIRARSDT